MIIFKQYVRDGVLKTYFFIILTFWYEALDEENNSTKFQITQIRGITLSGIVQTILLSIGNPS